MGRVIYILVLMAFASTIYVLHMDLKKLENGLNQQKVILDKHQEVMKRQSDIIDSLIDNILYLRGNYTYGKRMCTKKRA